MVKLYVDRCCCFSVRTGTLILCSCTIIISMLSLLSIATETYDNEKANRYVSVSIQPFAIFGLIAATLGIVSFMKDIPFLLAPYLIYMCSRTMSYVVVLVLLIVYGAMISFIMGTIISIMIYAYFTIVVFSCYQDLNSAKEPTSGSGDVEASDE